VRDESFFFVRVGELCRKPVITCPPGEDLTAVADVMRRRNISCVVVAEEDRPLGMITDRDFRNRIASTGGDLKGCVAGDVMTSPVVTIAPQDCVFEAIYKMAKHNIHRLVVVNEAGGLAGILTDTDLIALQITTPLYLGNEIRSASSLRDLKQVNRRLLDTVKLGIRSGASPRDLVRLITHFNDAVTHRVIELIREEEGIELPPRSAYLALGSEGRKEQTLRTDQDSAAVHADDLSAPELSALERFCVRLVEALHGIGVPLCPANNMASNPAWRKSLSEWSNLVGRWIAVPLPEHMLNFGMFQDLRTIHGDPELERALKGRIREAVRQNALFLPRVAQNILRYPPPLGLFGRLRVEKTGEHKGSIDLKKAGIFAITEGVSLLALEAGILDGGTWEKIEALRAKKLVAEDLLAEMDESFTFLVRLRLESQIRELVAERKPSNHLDPLHLPPWERKKLRNALRSVRSFLGALRERYRLDLISS